MVVSCEQVWQEVSNYLDAEVEPELRAAIDQHVRGCRCCAAVMDGVRNVMQLYADERMLELPLGFSRRLHRRLEGELGGTRRSFFGWMAAAAVSVLAAGAFEAARSSVFSRPGLRSQHARTSGHVPPDMLVVVAENGKTFHVSGCRFIHDQRSLRTIPAREAIEEGYVPCVRCMKKYLESGARLGAVDPAPPDLARS
ncbi:MAG: zf-HC2 domain-containing protein [Acidobacteria bacterium]|nr:zf-HC2 domain-containing protein [Acidobacteriota bacterium]